MWAGLRDPLLGGLLLFSFLLVALAYQARVPVTLEAGRRPEELYQQGFYDVERLGNLAYRWTAAEAHLDLPGLGWAAYRLDLRLAAQRPSDQSAPLLTLEAAGRPLLETPVAPDLATYTLLLPPQALPGGDLTLVLRSNTFTTTADSRCLGVVWQRLEVRPESGPIGPPWTVFLWAGLSVLLSVLLARHLGWPRGIALGLGALLALSLGAALARERTLLGPGLPYVPLALAGAWAATVLGQGGVRRLFAWGGAPLAPRTERFLWSVVSFFLAVRLAGVLHPALETWDLCFHWHRLQMVTQGQVFFTILSNEWRGMETLYLPSFYLLLAPFWSLLGGRLALLKVAAVLLDTSAALLVAYIAHRLLEKGPAVPLAALLYLTMPLSYLLFSWGIVANVFGQWLFLLALAVAVSPAGRLRNGRAWLGATGLLLLALLSHPGAVLLTGVLLAVFLTTVWLAPLPPAWPRPAAQRWYLAGLVVVGSALLLYYSHFAGTMWASLQQMGRGAGVEKPTAGGFLVQGQVVDPNLGLRVVEVTGPAEAVLAGVGELAAEARAYFHTWPEALALAALAGWLVEKRPLAVRLGGLAFTVALFFAVVGLAVNLYVRYNYFLLPFVSLGTAWWLAHLARRRWAGRLVAVSAGLFLIVTGLAFWVHQVLYYSAGCR